MQPEVRRERQEIWEKSLLIKGIEETEGNENLTTSLVGELAEYLGIGFDEAYERCRAGSRMLSEEWQIASPAESDEISGFYRETESYLYDLTWWHTLSEDDSALVQVEALEVALEHRARKVLDFGCGIGSLGLIFAAHDFDVTLADINPTLGDYARWRFRQRNLKADFVDTDSQELHDSTFDFISAVDVMEHLPEPETVLRSLANALKPGGTLYIHLPPDADDSRPMHLWHDREKLLEDLDGCGLWLEKSEGSSLVLRRGNAPRCSLEGNLSLLETKGGHVLLSKRPLAAFRLNGGAARIISALGEGETATNIARDTKLSTVATTNFLDGMVEKRVLVREYSPFPARWPKASIIIPAKNRPEQTRECVESLLALNYPKGLVEIIVVDDASNVPLSESLQDLPVKVIRLDTNIGQSAARNLAAREASGEIVAFTDNDCFVDKGWLKSLASRMCEPGTDVVGGRILSPPPDGKVAAFESVRSPLDMGEVGSEVGHTERVAYIPSCNIAMDRGLFLEIGGFREEMLLGEDVDLVWRAAKTGRGVYYEPRAEVLHYHRTKPGELLRRRMDYASSEADLQLRHPETMRTMLLPIAVVLALIAVPVLPVAWWLSLTMVLFAVVSVVTEIVTKSRRLGSAGVRLPASDVASAVLRQHGAGLYHLGSNITRYYSLPLLAVSVFHPALLPSVLVLMVVPAGLDHRRKKPGLSFVTFVLLYWLELSAYQVGVWRGCFERRTIRPLLAKITVGR